MQIKRSDNFFPKSLSFILTLRESYGNRFCSQMATAVSFLSSAAARDPLNNHPTRNTTTTALQQSRKGPSFLEESRNGPSYLEQSRNNSLQQEASSAGHSTSTLLELQLRNLVLLIRSITNVLCSFLKVTQQYWNTV